MKFYNDPEKVDKYETMCEEYDGTELYKVLDNNLKENSSILELGCGPGNDISNLKKKYKVKGSDLSDEFIKRCKKKFPDIKFEKLDAIKIETDEKFDCVFSNKVLHHLKTEELEESLERQQSVINKNGLFAHSFWIGEKEFIMEDMFFVYHDREKLLKMVSKYFTVVDAYDYKEIEEDDSILIIAVNNVTA